MKKRLIAVVAGVALAMMPMTAFAEEGPSAGMPADCAAHHDDPGHIGWMASTMGGRHVAEMAATGHLGHMASMFGRTTAEDARSGR